MKILPVGAELLHTDGQTDRHDETNSRFSQFCEKHLIKKPIQINGRVDVNQLALGEVLVELNGQKWPSQWRRSPRPPQTLRREVSRD
jgi:hypothetical protein